ncbi:MAG: replication factor C large subunit [Patescibacteria group bacterium]|jgi:replication factor C large subunit
MINLENLPWAEKYRVKSFSEIKGQTFAIEKVKQFLSSFPRKKSLILHGPPGIGKTSLAYAISLENDNEILELNASNLRNKSKIAEVIGPAVQQKSLFKESKIILVDEVDGISSTKDRGGLIELLGLIEKSAYPIIITANNIWDKKFNALRTKSEVVQLKELEYKTIADLLNEVCQKENIVVSNDVLTSIALKARGDVRAALNDLQMLSKMDSPELIKEVGQRNKEESIFSALQQIFKRSEIDENMIGVFDEINMPIDEIFMWIEENITLEYKSEELVRAYNALSLADVFRGRIYRQQHWRFMIYEYFLLGPAIAAAKKYNRTGFTNYKKPTRILKIWLNNQRMAKKKTICAKYARHVHTSLKEAMKDFMLIKIILKNQTIREQLELSSDEITYLDKPMIS